MDDSLKTTPLFQAHKALGARMVGFGGWHMPVSYSGIIDEHKAVRSGVGLFDVSHMGEVSLRGPGALGAAQKLCTNAVTRLEDGQALYTVMCYPDGGIVDDCIVYRKSDDHVLIVVNASNIEKDFQWMRQSAGAMADIQDESDDTALIAVQGPRAVPLVRRLTQAPVDELGAFRFAAAEVAGVRAMVSRTGYTGEDGFEIACPAGDAVRLWNALLEEGKADGIKPAGLGARDTLRLEARLCLYGNDIDETTTPLEAGLGWVVKLDHADFIGKEALARQKAEGVRRKLVGFVVKGRGIARHDYPILDGMGGPEIGKVTSGTTGPTVGEAIGMGYVPAEKSQPGTTLAVDCRGKKVPVEIHKGPFYRRSKEG